MVTLTGAELFTGNCLLAIPWLSRAVTARQVLRSWIVVYLGNFVGAVLAAAAAVYSHQLASFSGALAASAMSTAVAKCSLSVSDAFLRGVVCNILVCVAVWLALSSRSVPGKVLGIYLPVMLFVVSGFEHSVANIVLCSRGPAGKGSSGVCRCVGRDRWKLPHLGPLSDG